MLNALPVLRYIHFADLQKWSAEMSVFSGLKPKYPLRPLYSILTRSKNVIVVEDEKSYKQITVRLYGQGVILRGERLGKEIGTKRQFTAKSGQLIISRIDARNGAFGIVPDELDGAIVTNDFWLFDVIDALPEYLVLVLSSDPFQQYWQSKSSGTTNRQRVNEADFLSSMVALPNVDIQKSILAKYDTAIGQASSAKSKIRALNNCIESYLCQQTGLLDVMTPPGEKLLNTTTLKAIQTRWEWDDLSAEIESAFANCTYPVVTLGACASFTMRSWKKNACKDNTFMYIEIGGINTDSEKAIANKTAIGKSPSRATQIVHSGDLIIGMTRPYLKRFAVITDEQEGFVCSSGFLVIEQSPHYSVEYLIAILKTNVVEKQFRKLMTGALYPAVNSDQIRQVRIPFPPLDEQIRISEHISKIKKEIETLQQKAEQLQKDAKKAFGEAIFGE